jgi:hypothetical protein
LVKESYVEALMSEQEYEERVTHLLSEIRERLKLEAAESPLSQEEVRAMFARYQQAAPSSRRRISQLVADMRDE